MKKLIALDSIATIVIVHGAFEHAGRYDALAKQFLNDSVSVIYGDLPGQGSSDGRKGHIKRFHEYIHSIREWLQEADKKKPVFLLGHSMGGTAVIRAMEELQPEVDGVILSSPAVGILNGAGKPLEAVSRVMNLFIPTFRVKAPMNPEKVTRNQTVISRDKQDALILDKVSIRWYREFQKAIRESFNHIGRFPDVPLLVMQAEDDLMVDVDKTKEWFNKIDCKEKSYKQWPGYYHEIFNEPEWKEVYQYTLDFLHKHIG